MKDSGAGRRAHLTLADGSSKPARSAHRLIRFGTAGAVLLTSGAVATAVRVAMTPAERNSELAAFAMIQSVAALALVVVSAIGAIAALHQISAAVSIAAEHERASRDSTEERKSYSTLTILDRKRIAQCTREFEDLLARCNYRIARVRRDVVRAEREHPLRSFEIARGGFDALVEIADAHCRGRMDPDLLNARVARLAHIAVYCYLERFFAFSHGNWYARRQIRQFLRDTRPWVREHEPWIEESIPAFFIDVERYFGDRTA